jgi:tungstate transport system substrate-binding protein
MKRSICTNIIMAVFLGVLTLSSSSLIGREQVEKRMVQKQSAAEKPKQAKRIRVATTTSLYDTGLWGHLEPMFEEKYGVELDVIYAGTGIALQYGKRGDVDVITIHSKSREKKFVADGYGVERIPFAYNYFLIAGPTEDPAGIKGRTPVEAFEKLAGSTGIRFVSRGDDSGTHGKEKEIWETAGYSGYDVIKESGDWYIEAGRGMGPTLLMASEKHAYTLSDLGTFLTYRGSIDLVPLVERGDLLLNEYSVIVCTRGKDPEAGHTSADKLVEFLTSPEIQKRIGSYGLQQYGVPLFTPCAGEEPGE